MTIGCSKSLKLKVFGHEIGSKLARTKDKDAILDGSNFILFKL